MRRFLATVSIAFALLLSSSCSSDDPTVQTQFFSIVFDDFVAAQPLVVPGPATLVFRDAVAWETFWQANAPLVGPAPFVDFTQDMLIGVFWGAQGTGCSSWAASIEEIRLRIDGVNTTGVIEVEIGALGNFGNCAMPINPLQVVVVDTTITPVQFVGMVPN